MSIVHYLVGLTYYPVVTMSLGQAATSPDVGLLLLGALLFVAMSAWQHCCHRYLASLRSANHALRYPLPRYALARYCQPLHACMHTCIGGLGFKC